jgi:hypothetical protein
MINSDFAMPIIEERPPVMFPQGIQTVEPTPTPCYNIIPEVGSVNGSRILHAVRYDYSVAAAIIAPRKNYKQLLASIMSPELIKNVGAVVVAIRQGLGLAVDLDIPALTGEGKVSDLNSGG